jgi:hypothetical protein
VTTAEVRSPRRYFLLKQRSHLDTDPELSSAFKAKHDAEPGTAFPETIPSQAALAAGGYTTVEDADGADVDELVTWAALNRREAEAVLAAIAEFVSEEESP